MSKCGQHAVLIVTREVEGTSTSVARTRVELKCGLESGHEGPHRDLEHEEEWETTDTTGFNALLRHEGSESK